MSEDGLSDDELNRMMFGGTRQGFEVGGPRGVQMVVVEAFQSGFVVIDGNISPTFRINGRGPIFVIGDGVSEGVSRPASFFVHATIGQLLKALDECEEYRGNR